MDRLRRMLGRALLGLGVRLVDVGIWLDPVEMPAGAADRMRARFDDIRRSDRRNGYKQN